MRTRSYQDKHVVIIDFKADIVRELGAHYDHAMRHNYTYPCPICESRIKQDWDECYCGAAVVWENSQLWKDTHGSPNDRLRRLRQYPPETLPGKRLIRMAGRYVQGFKFESHRDEWQRLCRKASQEQLDRTFAVIAKNNPTYGRVKHAINYLRVIVNDDGTDDAPPPRPKRTPEEKEVRF